MVSLQKVGNKIHFIVQNKHSQDLPDGEVDFLFDRFYSVDRSRNSQTGGHGIGLSVAKSLNPWIAPLEVKLSQPSCHNLI